MTYLTFAVFWTSVCFQRELYDWSERVSFRLWEEMIPHIPQ